MQSLMGETTAVAHGGDPLWRRCLPKTALHRLAKGAGTEAVGHATRTEQGEEAVFRKFY
ncbi:MAG: hypothetical protein F6J98_07820 [Moorea sp. SIO4G2]|nr:hypothetical protein [Moorena sp. SIO4G2]